MNKFSIILILILSILFTNCFTPIRKIVKNPESYDTKNVKIKGRVVSSLELEDLNIFYLENKNQTIAVITEAYLPVKNEILVVKGEVINGFDYHQRWKLLVVYEKIKIKEAKIKKGKYNYLNKKYYNLNEDPYNKTP